MTTRKHGVQNRRRNAFGPQIENAVSRQIVVDILVLNIGYNRFLVDGRILQFENIIHSDCILSLNAGHGTPKSKRDQPKLPTQIVYMHNPVPFDCFDDDGIGRIQHVPPQTQPLKASITTQHTAIEYVTVIN
jgi:hypothetical protein